MDKEGDHTNRPKDKNVNGDVQKALYIRDDIERLCQEKKGNIFNSVEDCVVASRTSEHNSKERKKTNHCSQFQKWQIDTERRTRKTRKQKWEERGMRGDFKRKDGEFAYVKTWTWQWTEISSEKMNLLKEQHKTTP